MSQALLPDILPSPGPELRELGLSATPRAVAEYLRPLGGLVWLDSSSAEIGSGMRSFLAAAPRAVLRGSIWQDWHLVEDALLQRKGQTGGLMGWAGYDGSFVFGVYDHWLIYDHDCELWFGSGDLPEELPEAQIQSPAALSFQPQMARADFIAAVEQAQRYIAAGDIYQVNLACEWQAPCSPELDPLALYDGLRQVSPAPYAAYMELGGGAVISSSPECFLRMQQRHISTRPIKGTRPRFPDNPQRDENSAHELAHSPKERAELLMITDLERNDLGMVCEYGTVRVPELAAVERYAQVFHLVSTVTGTLRPEISHAAAFKTCFPGGSITGAPKKRASEIIQELEPTARGLYTGAMGYFGFGGTSEFSIAIRTAVKKDATVSFHVGAGIVADSIPAMEWEETLHKADGLLRMSTYLWQE